LRGVLGGSGAEGGSIEQAQTGEREVEQKEAKGTKGWWGEFARRFVWSGAEGGSIEQAQKGERKIEQKEA
jgi:hypothetical protein